MSELTLEDFFAESETYGDEQYDQIPEEDREVINEILRGLSGVPDESDESSEEQEPKPA